MDPKTFDLCEGFRVTNDKLMPLAYQQFSDPPGRFLHDDWAIFKSTRRMDTIRRIPLPLKGTKGLFVKRWVLWDPSYPKSPEIVLIVRPIWDGEKEQLLPHALIDCAVEDSGWAEFSAWLDGEWRPVFKQYRRVVMGRRLAYYSGGLKQDTTAVPMLDGTVKSDLAGWFEFPTCSWTAVKK